MSEKSRSSVKSTRDSARHAAPDVGVFRTTQPFVRNGVAIPTRRAKKFSGLKEQVFVDLRAHARILRRKRQNPFVRQIGGVGQGGLNSLGGDRWVAANDFARGQPVGQIGKHDGNRNLTPALQPRR